MSLGSVVTQWRSNATSVAPVDAASYREYPKWVGDKLVANEDEELAALDDIARVHAEAEAAAEAETEAKAP